MLAAPVWSDGVMVVGKVLLAGAEVDVNYTLLNFTSAEANPKTLIAAVPTKKIRVIGLWMFCSVNSDLEWRSNTTVILPIMTVAARAQVGGMFLPTWFMETAAGEALTLRQTQGVQGNLRGAISWIEV